MYIHFLENKTIFWPSTSTRRSEVFDRCNLVLIAPPIIRHLFFIWKVIKISILFIDPYYLSDKFRKSMLQKNS